MKFKIQVFRIHYYLHLGELTGAKQMWGKPEILFDQDWNLKKNIFEGLLFLT